MELKAYECIHCHKHTDNHAEVHMRFYQRKLNYMYGQYYEGEGQVVDHGYVPVFVCDDCIREQLWVGTARGADLVSALVVVALAIASIVQGSLLLARIAIVGMLAFATMPFVRNAGLNATYDKQYAHRINSVGGLSNDTMKQLSRMNTFSLSDLIPLGVCLVYSILLFVAKQGTTLARVMPWVMLVTYGLCALGIAGVYLTMKHEERHPDEKVIGSAALFYLRTDYGIEMYYGF